MLSVNAHGGLIALAAAVEKGQTILIENRNTREEREFRVVDVSSARDGKWHVGIEFANVPTNFWRIYFRQSTSIAVTPVGLSFQVHREPGEGQFATRC